MGAQAPQGSIWRTKTAPMAQPAPTKQNTGFGLTGDYDMYDYGEPSAPPSAQPVTDLGFGQGGIGSNDLDHPIASPLNPEYGYGGKGGLNPNPMMDGITPLRYDQAPTPAQAAAIANDLKNSPATAPGVVGLDTEAVIRPWDPATGGQGGPGGGTGMDGPPAYPAYQSMMDENNQLLPGFLSAGGGAVTSRDVTASPVDRRALDNLRLRGMSSGPSPWLDMMNGRIGGMQSGYTDDAVRGARQATTSAMDQAALRGGLSGGASARLAGRGLESSAMGQQGAAKWGADARLQAGMEDERTKLGILQQLPGQELALGQYYTGVDERNRDSTLRGDVFNSGQTQQNNQFNVGTAVTDRKLQTLRDAAAHGQDVSAWVGMNNANAVASTGSDRDDRWWLPKNWSW